MHKAGVARLVKFLGAQNSLVHVPMRRRSDLPCADPSRLHGAS